MILYCLVMNVSVAQLFMAGFLPGFLIGGVFMTYAWLLARRRGWRSEEAAPTRQESARVLKEGTWALMLPGLVLGGIYAGVFTPTEAAAVSVVYALGVEMLVYRELTWSRLFKVCRDSAMLSASLLFILACSMAFVWLLTAERIPMAVADWIVANVHSGFMFLVGVSLLFLLLGMVMDDVSAMLILAPIFGETLHRYGIDLVHFGIVMVLLIEYGFLTPPFGLNLFVTMGMTGESLTSVSRAVAPFLLLLLACMLLVIFIPEISLFLPKLLLPHIK
jgi:C4-dicarboxylate transporter DctM subunit